jgi:hypothetical protein
MRSDLVIAATFLAAFSAAAASAGVSNFSMVNGAGDAISSLSIRRVGAPAWRPVTVTAAVGQTVPVNFSDPDCAFDVRATLANGAIVTWRGVNLCDVTRVTLHRNAAGLVWVDYD